MVPSTRLFGGNCWGTRHVVAQQQRSCLLGGVAGYAAMRCGENVLHISCGGSISPRSHVITAVSHVIT